jgi:hypothetical protein
MTSIRTRIPVVAAALSVFAGAGAAVAGAPVKVTPSGVGAIKLGTTYTSLHRRGLVGRIHHGCVLGGPNTRAADLRAPLKGTVDFTLSSPRKVTDISVSKGAAARGVGIGATIRQIRTAFPKAKVDHSTDKMFGTTLVRIPKNGGGRLQFAVDVKTHKTVLIGVPFIAVCE